MTTQDNYKQPVKEAIPVFEVKKAERKQAKLRLALAGPSGSGKTYSALMIARNLGGPIACIDTERGSASLYSHLCDFDVIELDPPYSPQRFVAALRQLEARKQYTSCIIDSITHEWNGTGGCQEMVDTLTATRFKGNSWGAWSVVTPAHRLFLDAINQSPLHLIACIRSKTETAQGADKKVVKLGMKAEQRDGIEYEFTTVLDLIHEGNKATVTKDRTGLFDPNDPQRIDDTTGRRLIDWLNSGASPKHEKYDSALRAIHKATGDPKAMARCRAAVLKYVEDKVLTTDQGQELLALCVVPEAKVMNG